MSQVNCPEEILNHIWYVFDISRGAVDPQQMIEGMAFLLLLHRQDTEWQELKSMDDPGPDEFSTKIVDFFRNIVAFPFINWDASKQNKLPFPSPPSYLSNEQLRQIIQLIEAALEKVPSNYLLNQCLVTRIEMRAGGRYATPRHIAKTMARLGAKLCGTEKPDIADFACGSGGLLVAVDSPGSALGIDISANWARIATANLVLHNVPNLSIRVGDTLSLMSISKVNKRFNSILMNPPFGLPMDRYLVQESLGWDGRVRSETALTMLAQAHLKPGGSLAVLLPGGSLFSTSRSELELREALLRRGHLSAVVELPKDSFQPYSTLQTYLLLARNTPERAEEPVWFYQMRHDGYGSGRNRQPEPDKNELPRLEAAILSQLRNPDINVRYQEGSQIFSLHRLAENQGFCFHKHIPHGEIKLEKLTNLSGSQAGLMGSISGKQEQATAYILVHSDELFASTDQTTSLNFPHELLPKSATKDEPAKQYQLTGDKLADFAIVTKRSKGSISFTLEKKGKRQDVFEPCSRRSDNPCIWLLVDMEGQLITEPLTTKKAPPKELLPETVAAIPLEDEEQNPLGHLIILKEPNIQGAPLRAPTEAKSLPQLVPLPDGYWLIWPEDGNRFARFEVLGSELKFQGDEHRRGVAVDNAGSWFGVGIAHQFIVEDRKLDLQPTSYFPAEREEEEVREPAEILAEITTKHRRLEDHINYLLGIVELTPIAQTEIPPAVAMVQPIGPLSPIQEQIWAAIQQQTEPIAGTNFVTATPFRLEDVGQGADRIEAENALTLFERMGLIVPISIDAAPYFRLLTSRDVGETEAAG